METRPIKGVTLSKQKPNMRKWYGVRIASTERIITVIILALITMIGAWRKIISAHTEKGKIMAKKKNEEKAVARVCVW
jgi:hypothetical protein